MVRTIATIAALSALSTATLAADLPVRALPVAPAPVTTWTGCYIGGNIGGAFGHASISGVAGTVSGSGSGVTGGGQIGCDYQFNGGWVIGFRDMFDATSNKRSSAFLAGPLAGDVVDFKNQWFNALTGRLGYAFAPTSLVYVQGGAAWAHTRTDVIVSGSPFGLTSATRTGWTIGGGLEWMFMPRWSVFLEGNYMDFGSKSGIVVTPVGTGCVVGCAFTAKANETTVLAGVNYRFW
jgi:outer membrane immunogenic protein